MHAERPALGRDVDQCSQEVRGCLQHPRELVEDHHKAGERGQPRRGAQSFPVLVDLAAVAGEQGLPAVHLRPYRGEDPVGRGLVEDVRRRLAGGADERDDMRAALEREERAAALEVDEDKVQLVGSVGQQQRRDERLQQDALAGAGGTTEHRVRTLSGEVDGDRPVPIRAEEHPGGRPRLVRPQGEHVVRGCHPHADKVEKTHRVRDGCLRVAQRQPVT